MKKLPAHPLILLFVKDIDKLEHDPKTQFKFNRKMMTFWIFNMPAVIALYIYAPKEWHDFEALYLSVSNIWGIIIMHLGNMSTAIAAYNTQNTEGHVHDIRDTVEQLHPELLEAEVASQFV